MCAIHTQNDPATSSMGTQPISRRSKPSETAQWLSMCLIVHSLCGLVLGVIIRRRLRAAAAPMQG